MKRKRREKGKPFHFTKFMNEDVIKKDGWRDMKTFVCSVNPV